MENIVVHGFILIFDNLEDFEILQKTYIFDGDDDLEDFILKLSDAFSHETSGKIPTIVPLKEYMDFEEEISSLI